ncbi:hypothetical protein FA95DRAFT_1610938 [Auriscalpium vulgare]|uniref:Uncharacterized protein n=1 Tax=Auriscalpium vulgare TaxID=40419 RepID=A0ACB8RBS5_9AGAM|nr:hypothetical protein FA95DRAFT_1610938 [Auriscalpium vulgare]
MVPTLSTHRTEETPTGSVSYWTDAKETRLIQLGVVPVYDVDLSSASTVHAVDEHEARLLKTLKLISLGQREEVASLKDILEAVRNHYDTHTNAVRSALQAVRSKHNTLLPVSRLPPETLERTFLWLSLLDPTTSKSPGWIRGATHVCRSWRTIALGYPRLWTTVVLPPPGTKWGSLMLTRSEPHPLSISAVFDILTDIAATVDFLVANLYRTQSLRIVHGRSYSRPVLSDSVAICPLLKEIDMEISSDRTLGLPGRFLTVSQPALCSLRVVTPSAFDWSSPCLANLVNLELQSSNIIDRNKPRLLDVVDALQRMVALETLVLAIAFAATGSQEETNTVAEPVQLPQMSKMIITASIDDVKRLLQRIQLPTTARFRMYISKSHPRAQDEDPSAFFTALIPSLHGSGEPITKLSISSTETWLSLVTAGTQVLVLAWRGSVRTYTAPIVLEFPQGSRRWGRGALTREAVRVFASDNISELSVMDVAWDERAWAVALAKLPAIKRIDAAQSGAAALCRVLAQGLSTDGTLTDVMLPALVTLQLRDVHLHARYAPGAQRIDDALPNCLSARARAGYVVILDLRRCPPARAIHLDKFRAKLPSTHLCLPVANTGDPLYAMWFISVSTTVLDGKQEISFSGTLMLCTRSDEAFIAIDQVNLNNGGDGAPVMMNGYLGTRMAQLPAPILHEVSTTGANELVVPTLRRLHFSI